MHTIWLVAALGERNRVIGKEGKVPWRLPSDMKQFVELTNGHPVIMGRKTWESIPERFRPLKNRTNIILTRQTDYVAEGAVVVHSLDAALRAAKDSSKSEVIACIGGAEIYELMLPMADSLRLTLVDDDTEGDAHFPEFSTRRFWQMEVSEPIVENGVSYRFAHYVKG